MYDNKLGLWVIKHHNFLLICKKYIDVNIICGLSDPTPEFIQYTFRSLFGNVLCPEEGSLNRSQIFQSQCAWLQMCVSYRDIIVNDLNFGFASA